LEDTLNQGQQGESEHSLGKTLPMAIFPKIAQHRKHICLEGYRTYACFLLIRVKLASQAHAHYEAMPPNIYSFNVSNYLVIKEQMNLLKT
jgi:hypothetical protein